MNEKKNMANLSFINLEKAYERLNRKPTGK